jgi:hypothetical protein
VDYKVIAKFVKKDPVLIFFREVSWWFTYDSLILIMNQIFRSNGFSLSEERWI